MSSAPNPQAPTPKSVSAPLVFDRWDKRFFEGAILFNKKEYFKAHEEWELIWIETAKDSPIRNFYKGLIQVAAIFEHIRRRNLQGAAGLMATAIPLLEAYPPRHLGLDVKALLDDLEPIAHQILNTDDYEPVRAPQIKLWAEKI
jgi:hypothetical protein